MKKTGILPSAHWKWLHWGQRWYTGDTINTGIGQGMLLATPLQLATATAILANQGIACKPHLLKAYQSPDHLWHTTAPNCTEKTHFSQKNWHLITQAMAHVLTWGTGYRFGRPNYSVAAKTGTAQVINNNHALKNVPFHLRDHSLFIAFAPIDHPKIALAVIMEHAPTAPTVARAMMDTFFKPLPKKTDKTLKDQ